MAEGEDDPDPWEYRQGGQDRCEARGFKIRCRVQGRQGRTIEGQGISNKVPRAGQTVVIRPYRKTGPIKAENKIRFDLLDEVRGEYTAKHYAYASDLLTIELTRQGLFRVKFNDTPRYPQIVEIIETLLLGRAKPRESC